MKIENGSAPARHIFNFQFLNFQFRLIPAATGLKRYRTIDISPTEPITREFFAQQDATLLQALEEIGEVGTDALGDLNFGGQPGSDSVSSHDAIEAEEIPEVDSPLDE